MVLVTVAAILVPRFLTTPPRPASPVVTIDSGADGLACDQDASWSPTGNEVAVLGYETPCPNTESVQLYEPGQVMIYSAQTGKLVTSFALDPLILRTAHLALGQPIAIGNDTQFAPYIQYQAVLWSPTGEQLAFPFIVLQHPYNFLQPNFQQQVQVPLPTQAGVLLTTLGGTTPKVYLAPYTLPRTGQAPGMEWDLQTGKLLAGALSLPPALSYSWGPNGALLPLQPLNSTTPPPAAAPPAAVGDPIGGTSFTIWQPGVASQGYYLNPTQGTSEAPPTFVPGLYLWYSNFAVWSPDGRYLMTPAYYGGRMVLPRQSSTSSHDLQATGQEQAPIFPPHDHVLQTLYTATIYMPVTWRPDGKVLAALSFHSTSGGNTSNALVTLWDCTSGKALRSFTVKNSGGGPAPFFLRWSPDGSHLFLLDTNLGLVTIWPTG